MTKYFLFATEIQKNGHFYQKRHRIKRRGHKPRTVLEL